jgi:hypothetical protein
MPHTKVVRDISCTADVQKKFRLTLFFTSLPTN